MDQLDSIDTFNSLAGICDTGLPLFFRTAENKNLFQACSNKQVTLHFNQLLLPNGKSECLNVIEKNYSLKNIAALKQIAFNLSNGSKFNIDDETLTSVYEGHSVFSLFEERLKFH